MIRIENIGKVFNPHSRNRNEVLKNVSFELPEKGLICIYGKSGSGKTTLLNIIGGLDKQDTGKIYINDLEVSKNVDKVRNQNIGFVFQNYYLEANQTIEQIMHNAMIIAGFKDEKEIKKRSHEALELVGMERFKHKQADSLSGGQKQRVAIARGLIKGADILLADEPTGNLDALNTMKIMDIFKEISKTKLVLIVTHEVTLIKKYADSYIQLVDGHLTQDDIIGEVFKYETEKNHIYIDKNDKKELSSGELNITTYGDPKLDKDDLDIYSKDGKVFLTVSKNVTIINNQSEKKIIFKGQDEEKTEDLKEIPEFSKSTSKKNGKLFKFKNILKLQKADSSERIYSTANIFKQIFILAIAIIMCFFSLTLFEILTNNIDNKLIKDDAFYLKLNSFDDIKRLPEELYESVDFFETKQRIGNFSYNDITALSGLRLRYSPKPLDEANIDKINIIYGSKPKDKQVLISKSLAEELKTKFRIEELNSDKAILLVLFENDFSVSGITDDETSIVYMHKEDYVNFLGVYNAVEFSDPDEIFFEKDFINNTYTTELVVAKDDIQMEVDEVRIEIGRNALYKMMSDTLQADYKVQVANSKLRENPGRTGIEIKNSTFYVKKFNITRENFKSDIRIIVHKDALKNIFVHLEPNIDSLSTLSDENNHFYFEVSTKDNLQWKDLKSKLKEERISLIDIPKEYDLESKQLIKDQLQDLTIFFVIMILLFFIYYFMEKSGSLKNSKEYGIYRAIGVNRSNLLYKETILTLVNNIFTYFIFYLLVTILMCIRYAIMNIAFGTFILIAIGVFIISTLIMLGISLIPYLFVIKETPSEILSRYDI